MSKVEIPEHLISKLGPSMKMDVHWIDVQLNDGTVYPKMIVRGGRFITGSSNDKNGNGALYFSSAQIKNIRRKKLFKWWPICA
jgi:hypothetical protein